MSVSNSSEPKTKEPFKAKRLHKPEDVAPIHQSDYESGLDEPKKLSVHGVFLNGVKDKWPCLLCGCPTEIPPFVTPGNEHSNWESPDEPPETTLHFNSFQTALINTAVMAISRLVGKPELKESRIQGVCEILRLFLRTEVAAGSRIWDEWKSRIDRGRVENCEWVNVVDSPNIKVNVTPVDASGEPVEVHLREEMSGNADVDENADGLYEDTDGDMYSE